MDRRNIFKGNVNTHAQAEVVLQPLEDIQTNIEHPTINGGHKCQPVDFLFIRVFKDVWREILCGWRKSSILPSLVLVLHLGRLVILKILLPRAHEMRHRY